MSTLLSNWSIIVFGNKVVLPSWLNLSFKANDIPIVLESASSPYVPAKYNKKLKKDEKLTK